MPPIITISVKKIRPGMMAPPASSAAKTASDDRGLAGSVLVSIVPLFCSDAVASGAAAPRNAADKYPDRWGKMCQIPVKLRQRPWRGNGSGTGLRL